MKRYTDLYSWARQTYGRRVIRIPVDLGQTCPNRDGSLGYKGCLYCNERGAGERTLAEQPLEEQVASMREIMERKWGKGHLTVAYAQNFTNTYGSKETLQAHCEALLGTGVDGISLATRVDALDREKVAYLRSLTSTHLVWLELGLQTVNERTLQWIGRGYTHEAFDRGYEEFGLAALNPIAHLIFDLPGETEADRMRSLQYVGQNGFFGVKIHQLYIEQGTALARAYAQHPWSMNTLEDYAHDVAKGLTYLPKDVVIHRLTGDGRKDRLIAPRWTLDKTKVLTTIDRQLKENHWEQGLLA